MNKSLKAKIYFEYGSQYKFAIAAGVQESVVSEVIHQRQDPSPEIKRKWAKLLKCKPEEIFMEAK